MTSFNALVTKQTEEQVNNDVQNGNQDEITSQDEVQSENAEVKLEIKAEPTFAKPKKPTKKIAGVNAGVFYTVIGSFVLGIAAFGGFIAYKKSQSNQEPDIAQVIAQKQQQQQVLEQPEQANMPALAPTKQAFNTDEKVQMAVKAQMGENIPESEQDINFGSQQSMTFNADGEIYDPNAQKEQPKTIKEILATKALDELTDEQLFAAFQILDRARTESEDSLRAVSERMQEKGIVPPTSVIEERRKARDLQIAEAIRNDMNAKFTATLSKMNENITLLNHNQVRMKQDFESAIRQISSKIEIDKMEAAKDKLRYEELSKANENLLSKYSITSIVNNRVWLKAKGQTKTLSYTVGDVIGDGIVIESIDKKNQIVHTTKGNIR